MEKIIDKLDNQYSVNTDGIVFSLKGNKKELKGKITNSGYREVILSHKGVKHYFLIHRLVALTFIENKYNARTVNHKDGNKLNNKLDNLEWMSDSDNLKHARNNGLLNSKINKEVAMQIFNDKGTVRELSKKYGISKTQIGYIKQSKRWME